MARRAVRIAPAALDARRRRSWLRRRWLGRLGVPCEFRAGSQCHSVRSPIAPNPLRTFRSRAEENSIGRIIASLATLTLLWGPLAYAEVDTPEISFSVTREGDLMQTDARVDLPVAPAVAWAVLTDYEGYPRFISSMRVSKIVARGPEGVVVEQKGRFSFLFFTQEIDSSMLVSESPPRVIESRAVAGDFRVLSGRYELGALENGVRVSYSGRLAPNFSVPAFVGTSIVRYILLRNFREMVGEMLRREAVARATAATGGR